MFHGIRLAGKTLLVWFCFGFSQAALAVPLSGSYFVGAGEAYTTINAAVTALNNNGISGPVTFKIRNGTYDEQVTILNFTRTGNADDRVTFRKSGPLDTVNWKFTGANSVGNNYVIKLDGSSYITIRGMTFTAAGTSPYGKIISLEGSASDNNIENNSFSGFNNTTDDKGTLILQSDVGSHPDNHFTGNSFTNGYKAIDMDYAFGGADSWGLLIDGNTFASQTRSAIETGSGSAVITNNTIADGTVSDVTYSGMDVEDHSATIENNSVDIRKGWVGISNFGSGGQGTESKIINNMVSMHSISSQSGINVATSNVSVYHNTVSVRAEPGTAALEIADSVTLIRVKNNILSHDAEGGVALWIRDAGSIEASDQNNIYSDGGTPLVKYDGLDYNTLADYQAASGLDQHSVSVATVYTQVSSSPYDLHLAAPSNTSVDLVAPFLADVSGDIDGNIRNTQITFMGADEGSGVEPLDNADSASGTFYTVGGTLPEFADPAEAIYHLNKRGIKAPVTFRVRAGTYTTHETINNIMRFGAVDDQVFFRAANQNNPPILRYMAGGASDNWVIRLNGADNVRFAKFIFTNLGDDAFSRLLVLNGDVDDLTVQLCEFNGATTETGDSAALVFSNSPGQDNFSFANNDFNSGGYGLYLLRSSDLDPSGNILNISGNTFTGQLNGIYTDRDTLSIDQNIITSPLDDAIAIHLLNSNDFDITANQLDQTGLASYGINLQSSVGRALIDTNAVANNFIAAKTGIDLNTDTEFVHISNNSITSGSFPIHAEGNDSGIFVQNNLLINTGTGPAFFYDSEFNPLALEDNNDLVNNTGALVFMDGVNYTDLAEYQTGMQNLGKTHGQNSRSVAVTFANGLDFLHLAGASIGDTNLVGLPLDYVVDDIDGDVRSVHLPYMGADEATTAFSSFIFIPNGGLSVSEDGTLDSFTVELSSQPTEDVSIELAVSDPSHALLSESMLTFTSANWNVPQGVFVTGIDDNIIHVEGALYLGGHDLSVVTLTSNSLDPAYDDINPPDLDLFVDETTSSTLSVSPGVDAAEPGTNGYFVISIDNGTTVNIDTELTIWPMTGGAAENVDYTLDVAGLTIPAGANSANVYITPIDDPDIEGSETVVLSARFLNHTFNAMHINPTAAEATINLLDDDAVTPAAFIFTPSGGLSVSEDGTTDNFTVELNSEPTDPVKIGLSVSDASHAGLSHNTLEFTSLNWNIPQQVTVTGLDDKIITFDGAQYFGQHDIAVVVGSSKSLDLDFDGLNPPDLSLSVDETTTATLSVTSGSDAEEPSLNGHFTISIDGGVTSNIDTIVTAWAMSGIATENTDYSLLPAGLTIPAGSGSSSVFVEPIDDPDDEGPETVVFTMTGINHVPQAMSINPGFSNAGIDIIDDDSPDLAELAVTVGNGTNSLENGETIIYTIEVNNIGATDVASASALSDVPLGGLVDINWTCAAGSGASCAAAGVGDISDTISLDAGSGLTYTVTATVSANPDENVQLQLAVTPDGENPTKASDTDVVRIWFKDGFE